MNKLFSNKVLMVFTLVLFFIPFIKADSDTVDIYIKAYVGGTIIKEKNCENYLSYQKCEIEGLTQKNCCWGKNGILGGIPGIYYAESQITYEKECYDTGEYNNCPSGEKTTITIGPKSLGFECLSIGDECDEDEECVPAGNIEGHCVQGNANGDKFCRPKDPWCGDQYCDDLNLETCEDATRQTDIRSCPNDPVCKYYVCENGCTLKNLPAGDYSYDMPYPQGAWTCDKCSHCDGEGNCVSDCIDEDNDGYGFQPNSFYNLECCETGSTLGDCDDKNPNISPDSSSSSYCDCNPNTGRGFIQGTNEGPIDLDININDDLCFDNIDNDCDALTDCFDSDCSPYGYEHPVKGRSCYGDCNQNYQIDSDDDRACCQNPSDCVINGKCVQSADEHGEFPNKHVCYNGEWYGGDTYEQACNFVVEDDKYDPNIYSHWGLSGNAGSGLCCGDDLNEYYAPDYLTQSSELAACCDQPNMFAIGGFCIESLEEKTTWDKTATGFCILEDQCLVNPNETNFQNTFEDATDINNPFNNPVRCIENRELIGDHYCYNGEWTSRTAIVSSQLLNVAQNKEEVSLFCDNYQNVLNNYDYNIIGNYAEYYLGVQGFQCKLSGNVAPCTNNICILKYKEDNTENVIVGMSLNHEVNAPIYSILEALGTSRTSCNSKLTSTSFESCGTGVWYNSNIKSVIYSKDSLNLGTIAIGNLLTYIKNLYMISLDFIGNSNPSSYDYSFVTSTNDFNVIYFEKKEDKTITLIKGEYNNSKFMSATYSNFETDICDYINDYIKVDPKLVPLNCIKQGNDIFVVTGGLSTGYYDIFNDLGAKLRIK